jgi:integrase
MPKLTKTAVETLASADKSLYLWDSTLAGFGIKVLPSGKRRYVVKYRHGGGRSGQQRWYQVGTHGTITLDQARDTARQVLAAVGRGEDPQASKQGFREAPTVAELWQRFETEHLSSRKPKTITNYKQVWRLHIAQQLAQKKVADVTRDDIYRLHRKVSHAPYQANRTLAVLSKMFNLAERWNIRADGTNPCRHVEKYKETARKRYLSSEEISTLGKSMRQGLISQEETPHMIGGIQLLLLTGARVSEILGAQWDWIDWERRILNLPDSKTGAKPIYLSEPAIDILKHLKSLPSADTNPYVIAGRNKGKPLDNLRKPWGRIQARAGRSGIRIHDLRHTAASIGVSQGMSLPVISRLLGHTQASTTQRYAHVGTDPALEAANKIGAVVAEALEIPNE